MSNRRRLRAADTLHKVRRLRPNMDPDWWRVPGRNLMLAKDVTVGTTLVGTGPSGPFDFGPVTVTGIRTEVEPAGLRRTTYLFDLDDGSMLGYWADTPLEVAS